MLNLLDGFFDVQNSATLVGATLRAGAMGKLLLVAVWTFRQTYGGQKVVSAAVGGPARRVAPFRIRHDAIPFVSPTPSGRTGPKLPLRHG